MAETKDLGEKAIGVFAFAAYHQLTSGQPVKSVVYEDGRGHKADDEAVSQLVDSQLATVEGNAIAFTEAGLAVLAKSIEGLTGAARAGR